jgi:hypothetical protein
MCREKPKVAGFNARAATLAPIAATGLLFYAAVITETRGLKKAPQFGPI